MRGRMREIRAYQRSPCHKRTLTTGGTEEHRIERRSGWPGGSGHPLAAYGTFSLVVAKVEQIHQIADRWTVQWNVGVLRAGYGIGEIVPAATRQRRCARYARPWCTERP